MSLNNDSWAVACHARGKEVVLLLVTSYLRAAPHYSLEYDVTHKKLMDMGIYHWSSRGWRNGQEEQIKKGDIIEFGNFKHWDACDAFIRDNLPKDVQEIAIGLWVTPIGKVFIRVGANPGMTPQRLAEILSVEYKVDNLPYVYR